MHQITLIVSQNVLMTEPYNTNEQFCNMFSKCPPPAHIHDLRLSRHWSIAASITFCSKSTRVCVKHFYRSQISQIFLRYTHCCINPKFYNLQVHFDEAYKMRLMLFSLVISHCNITLLLFRFSQGSVATLIR